MPRGDRTGPAGFGPMTGRGAGICAGYPVPGYLNDARGWGSGRGGGGMRRRHGYCGGRHGWGHGWMAVPAHATTAPFGPMMTKEHELQALKNQARHLEHALQDLRDRIREVESAPEGQS